MRYTLKKSEATYTIVLDGIAGHFGINCSCNSNEGITLRKDGEEDTIASRSTSQYRPGDPEQNNNYDFYLNKTIFRLLTEDPVTPLRLGCDGCQRSFEFSEKSFSDLEKQILKEGIHSED